MARYQPSGRQQGDPEHDRHENPGNPVSQLLDRCLVALRIRHQLDDLGKGGVLPDLRGLHAKRAAQIDGGAEHVVAHVLGRWHALARQHRLVDAGASLYDLAVHGDLLAGLNQQHIVDPHVVDGDLLLAAVTHEMRGLGPEIDKLLDCRARLAPAPRFEIAPEQDEGRNHRSSLEVEMLASGIEGPRAGEQRG